MSQIILVLGASGQIGGELTEKLRAIYGSTHVIASDIRNGDSLLMSSGPFEIIDATDKEAILTVVKKYGVTQIYLLAAMLSATGEKYPKKAWDLNMTSLLAVLDIAKEKYISQVYWPSSIAAFGPTSPKINTPQKTIMEPSTVYGISKLSGEFWCNYYHEKYDVDVRSLRYPGIISWKTKPGGGTTDYAVDIYHKALKDKNYRCFLSAKTTLPMMFMEDAIRATTKIMLAAPEEIKIRNAYNLAAISFNPEELAISIQKHIPDFTIEYEPDFRQAIADSWPASIDDSEARKDWGWKHEVSLDRMTEVMIANLK